MNKKRIYFGRIMTGYEFIELMREFRWRDPKTGKKLGKWAPFSKDGLSQDEIDGSLVNRKRFEGWEYWFGRVYPDEVLHEERIITYWLCNTDSTNGRCISRFLKKKGFHEIEEL